MRMDLIFPFSQGFPTKESNPLSIHFLMLLSEVSEVHATMYI